MEEITAFYDLDLEHDRLSRGLGLLEFARTLDVLGRLLPEPPATVLDIGGGTGAYARELLRLGHRVHFLDLIPGHVERVRADPALAALASVTLGDARALPYATASADAALVMGPLYHLMAAEDRAKALAEAARVVRPGGLVAVTAIPRAAAICGDFKHGLDEEDYSRAIRERAYTSGLYLNPEGRPGFFTTAYFHHPADLEEELGAAGLRDVTLYALEGPASKLLADPALELSDPLRRDGLLTALRLVERDPALLGMSAHLLGVGWR
ncbi:hypothetical protein DEIPH_ctg103orf0006 [Deinococcus phoenicis]|uniref:Methyltransferase type 11 domain-containing protein n=1 Tax=Deinococcus phoenicis TaxID=1476583 RepID=A0A016QKH7_9DEIO|nr:class I SAM-dependent methyltransferase [Deinococcus phoenicis]EYB66486.1 hypothetical protein DEIPH_ctg103orf0006 [Deinococcus phoenicis]